MDRERKRPSATNRTLPGAGLTRAEFLAKAINVSARPSPLSSGFERPPLSPAPPPAPPPSSAELPRAAPPAAPPAAPAPTPPSAQGQKRRRSFAPLPLPAHVRPRSPSFHITIKSEARMYIDATDTAHKKRVGKQNDVCPICKSSTYLNQGMIFKVNPECYHKMCTSCIDRIFHNGPNTCPVAGCGKYLRPQRFKVPRFEDLSIERECDIRARVAGILNHQESDFESLRAFNDYEEWKEDLIQSLISNTNSEAIEKQLREYAREHRDAIEANASAEVEHREQVRSSELARQARSELGRQEAVRERQEELAEREAGRREVLDKILHANENVLKVAKDAERAVQRRAAARAGTADAAAEAAAKTTLIKSSAQKPLPPSSSSSAAAAKAAASAPNSTTDQPSSGSSFKPAGLKSRPRKPAPGSTPAEKEEPYDPFGGLAIRFKYYTLNEGGYWHPWSNEADKDPRQAVPGAKAAEYQRRAQLEAHAGLGVFVGEEKAAKGAKG